MPSPRWLWPVSLVGAAAVTACSFLIPFSDYDAQPKPVDAGASCIDTTRDPKNCGACGHDCLESTCVDSLCTPTRVYESTDQALVVNTVRVDDASVWVGGFGAHGGIRTVSKADLSRQTVVFDDPTMHVGVLEIAADDVAWSEASVVDGGVVDAGIGWTSRAAPMRTTVGARGRSFAMHVDGDALYYFTIEGQALWVLRRGESSSTLIASPIDPAPTTDADDVYYFESDNRRLVAKPKGGGAVRVVANGVREGRAIVVEDEQVLYLDYGQPSGGVFTVPKRGGAPTPIATNLPRGIFLRATPSHLYVGLGESANPTTANPSGSLDAQILRIDRATGETLPLSQKHGLDDMDIDDRWVYWASRGIVFRVAL